MRGVIVAESDRQISAAQFFDSVSPNGQDKVRVPKMADIVADQIRSRIINGELKEGDFKLAINAVSYTHLTLPTIYSV